MCIELGTLTTLYSTDTISLYKSLDTVKELKNGMQAPTTEPFVLQVSIRKVDYSFTQGNMWDDPSRIHKQLASKENRCATSAGNGETLILLSTWNCLR